LSLPRLLPRPTDGFRAYPLSPARRRPCFPSWCSQPPVALLRTVLRPCPPSSLLPVQTAFLFAPVFVSARSSDFPARSAPAWPMIAASAPPLSDSPFAVRRCLLPALLLLLPSCPRSAFSSELRLLTAEFPLPHLLVSSSGIVSGCVRRSSASALTPPRPPGPRLALRPLASSLAPTSDATSHLLSALRAFSRLLFLRPTLVRVPTRPATVRLLPCCTPSPPLLPSYCRPSALSALPSPLVLPYSPCRLSSSAFSSCS